jgi:protein deglycase
MNQITVHLAEGFEEIEAITIIDVLRRAGLDVTIVSVTGNRMVKGSHNIEVKADLLFEEVDYSNGKMIVLPGGMPGSKNLNEHEGLKSQIIEYHKNGKYLAAICTAPIVFGSLGILKGKNAVCYPGSEALLMGAKVLGVPYIVDDMIITGRGVGAALQFSLEIVRMMKGEDWAIRLRKTMLID